MRKLAPTIILLLTFLLVAVAAKAGTVDAYYQFHDYTDSPLNVRRVVITPLGPSAEYGSAFLSQKPIIYSAATYPSLTNGYLLVTNLITGYAYKAAFSDGFSEPTVTNYFGTNLSGTVGAYSNQVTWIEWRAGRPTQIYGPYYGQTIIFNPDYVTNRESRTITFRNGLLVTNSISVLGGGSVATESSGLPGAGNVLAGSGGGSESNSVIAAKNVYAGSNVIAGAGQFFGHLGGTSNAPSAIATNSAAATNGMLLSVTGNNVKWVSPGGVSASEVAAIMATNGSGIPPVFPLTLPAADYWPNMTHPGIYDAGAGNSWNGYRYWMGTTPALYRDYIYQVPMIFTSDDLIHWKVPSGNFTNPIASIANARECATNAGYAQPNDHQWADTELFMVSNVLYCAFIHELSAGNGFWCMRSTNGSTWTSLTNKVGVTGPLPTLVYSRAGVACPEVVDLGTGLRWFYVLSDRKMRYVDSTYGFSFGSEQTTDLTNIWHFDVKLGSNGIYYALYTTTSPGTDVATGLAWAHSANALNWTVQSTNMVAKSGFKADSRGHYKPEIATINTLGSTTNISIVSGSSSQDGGNTLYGFWDTQQYWQLVSYLNVNVPHTTAQPTNTVSSPVVMNWTGQDWLARIPGVVDVDRAVANQVLVRWKIASSIYPNIDIKLTPTGVGIMTGTNTYAYATLHVGANDGTLASFLLGGNGQGVLGTAYDRGFRILAGQAFSDVYMEAGQSSSDTDAGVQFNRIGNSNNKLSRFKVLANKITLDGTVIIKSNSPSIIPTSPESPGDLLTWNSNGVPYYVQSFNQSSWMWTNQLTPLAEYPIPQVGKLKNLWWYKDIADGSVTTWTDRVSGEILTQTASSLKPTKSSTGITFDGGDGLTNAPGIYVPDGACLWIVFKPTSVSGSYQTLLGNTNGSTGIYVHSSNFHEYGSPSGNINITPVVNSITYEALMSITNYVSGSGNIIFTNGVSTSTAVVGGYLSSRWKGFGSKHDNSGEFYTGDILAIAIWTNSAAFTAADSVQLRNWRLTH